MIGVLRHRDFALLFWGGLVSVAGDWLLVAVLPYVVYVRTGSTIATAGMTVAELAPGIVLGSVAGVLVDRWDRRRLLVAVALLQALVVLGLLAFVADDSYLPVVYAVAAAQSALSAFSMPAESSLLPTLVGPEELLAANSLNALNNRVGRLGGLALGPVVYAVGGLGAVTLADAGSFLVAAGLVAMMRTRSDVPEEAEEPAEPGHFFVEWRDGLRVVRQDRSVAVLFVVFALMTFGGTMLDPLQAPWVRDVLRAGPGVYALLKTVHAASGIAGSLAVGAVGPSLSPRLLCGAGSVAAAVLLLVRYNVPVVGVAVALSAIAGAIAVASSVGVDTLAQQRVPEAYRGRVFGTLQAAIWLASLLGAVVGGVGATWLGVVGMLDVAAVLVGLSGVVVLVALPTEDGDSLRRMSTEGSTKAVVAALLANTGIAVTKFLAFLLTGASSMLAEAIHSVADSGNQGLLLLGGRQARRRPTEEHPFGYGRERYVYAFVVSIVLFSVGGLFALYEAYHKAHELHVTHGHPEGSLLDSRWAWVPIVVLVAALVMEGFSLRTALREAAHVKGDASYVEFVRRAKEPELPVILLEDLAALCGLVFALLGVGLALLTDNLWFDVLGTALIGALLVVVAIVLAIETKSLLIGESATAAAERRIVDALTGIDGIERVVHLKTMHLGPDELLVAAKIAVPAADTAAEVAAHINAAEASVRAAEPIARVIYLEPEIAQRR